jgi:hypothetical protein
VLQVDICYSKKVFDDTHEYKLWEIGACCAFVKSLKKPETPILEQVYQALGDELGLHVCTVAVYAHYLV